ncbi:MAG: hypothetical protein ACOVS5_04535 [Oligoflexus sp.]|jgi:hypothetical protein
MIRLGLISAVCLLLSLRAAAYGPCDADKEKLCESKDFHGETEKNCLHFNIEQVSNPQCKEFLKINEAEWKKSIESFATVQQECAEELKSTCPEVKADERRLKAKQTCLMSNREKLGESCKREINRHIREFQSHLREIE